MLAPDAMIVLGAKAGEHHAWFALVKDGEAAPRRLERPEISKVTGPRGMPPP